MNRLGSVSKAASAGANTNVMAMESSRTGASQRMAAIRTLGFAAQEAALAPPDAGTGPATVKGAAATTTTPDFDALLATAVSNPTTGCTDAFLKELAGKGGNFTAAQSASLITLFGAVDRSIKDRLMAGIGGPTTSLVVTRKVSDYVPSLGEGKDAQIDVASLATRLRPGEKLRSKPNASNQVGPKLEIEVGFADADLGLLFGELLKLPAAARKDPTCLGAIYPTDSGSSSYRPADSNNFAKSAFIAGKGAFEKSSGERFDRERKESRQDAWLDEAFTKAWRSNPANTTAKGKAKSESVLTKELAAALAVERQKSRNERIASLGAEQKAALGVHADAALTDEERKAKADKVADEVPVKQANTIRHEIGHAFDYRDHAAESWHAANGWTSHATLDALVAGVDLWAGATSTPDDAANKVAALAVLKQLTDAGAEPDIAAATAKKGQEQGVPATFAQWFGTTAGYKIFQAAPHPRDQWNQRHKVGGGFVNYHYLTKKFFQATPDLTTQLLAWNNSSAAFSPREWAAECYATWFQVTKAGDAAGTDPNVKNIPDKAQEWLRTVHAPAAAKQDAK